MSTIQFNHITKDYLSVGLDWSLPAWAPIERNYILVPGLSGGIQTEMQTGIRQLTVPIVIHSKSFEDKQSFIENMAAWLIHKDEKPLVFSKYPGRTFYAVIEGAPDFPEMWRLGKGTLNFSCPDPYKYGLHQTYRLTDGKKFLNQGTASAVPIFNILITAKRSNFQISVNGHPFRLIREFVAGDRVVIDSERQLVRLNDLDAMPIRDWRTPFKRLLMEPGENQLSADAGADVEVKFTERYL